jgi:polyisoprenoid-binding protein YceI
MTRWSLFRRRAVLAAVPTALLAAVVFSSGMDVHAQATATPTTTGVIQVAQQLPECGESQLGSLPAGTAADAVYSVVPEESEARYRVQEELAQVGKTEAVGKTRAIIGQLGFNANGMPLPCARFDVDLRTLQSDQAKRDNYLYNNTLEAEKYPLATFVLKEVDGLAVPLADGEEQTVTLIGDLTLRDVTKPVAWEATVKREGDAITGTAATEFKMADFSITPPSVPVVLSLDETVRLEFDVTAERVMDDG